MSLQRRRRILVGVVCGVVVTTLVMQGAFWRSSAGGRSVSSSSSSSSLPPPAKGDSDGLDKMKDNPQQRPVQDRVMKPPGHLTSPWTLKIRTPVGSAVGPPHSHNGQHPASDLMLKSGNTSFPATPAQLFASHDVSGESPDVLNDLYQRFLKMEESCANHRVAGTVTGIFKHDPSRVAYCFLPKVGCTFWIRVFSYLHNFTGDAVSSPWEIPRLKVHSTKHSHGVGWAPVREKVQDYLRFMFVRHPFSRLWSAYVDKLFLPDFWQVNGVPAVLKIRRQRASLKAQRCGNDVTFPEFVEYSLTTYEPHWEPIYRRCDPCQFRPTVLGSMKSFSSDSLFLLRRMGLEWVMKNVDQKLQEELELRTLVRYNFDRIDSKQFYRACVNHSTLARLLWKAFQMNGYIPDSAPFPSTSSRVMSVDEFESKVVDAFRAALPRRKELKEQKRHYLRQALASLPPQLMARVKTKYAPDMIYFGFNDTNY